MRRNIIATGIIATILLFAAPANSTAQTGTEAYIDISTTVEREVTPNELYLQITINEKDYKGKKTLEQMQEAMIAALKANHIDITRCLTLNYMGSEVNYKTFSKSIKPQTEATYLLRLNDAAVMQKVITSLEKRQISDIELARTRFTGEKELKNEMGIEAMQQAKAEAQMLAGAIGQEAGKAITISYWMNSGQTQPRIYKARRTNLAEDAAIDNEIGEPVINIGKNTYRFTVNVRFELK
ncbi:MAG: SIMPL domain-containing protein [Bacteroidaceae bacterium]|nr:SIMPL domain-containing protein [Bacteroidaceae bacterium]